LSVEEVIGIAIAVVVFGVPVGAWMLIIARRASRERAALKEHARANRAHYAAVEAAEDDPIFSPDVVERAVLQVVRIAQTIWQTGDLGALRVRPDSALVRAWALSRQAWLGHDLQVLGKPAVDLIRVVNRGDQTEDRVITRVRVRLLCKDPGLMLSERYFRLDERWTFGRSGGQWGLLSVDGDPLASPVLTAPLIPTPWSDTERLREESFADLANAQKVGPQVDLSALVSPDKPPALALPDLSVVDGRFAPGLIAAELAHLIEAWEEAVTGSEAPFAKLAGDEARAALLRPAPGARMVIRDAVLKSWAPSRLELSRRPPAVEVMLEVEAVRYVVGRRRAGSDTDRHPMNLTWLLELTDATRAPWRLASSNDPAEAIAGW
jgi:hypothetical protein